MAEQSAAPAMVISIEIGSERIAAALVSPDGDFGHLHSTETPAVDGGDAIIAAIMTLCGQIADQTEDTPLAGIGVSTMGLVDHNTGTIIQADGRLSVLQDVPVTQILQRELGLPTQIENAVNAMAVAESVLGAGRSCDSFFYIYADATLNSAFVQNGQIWRGAHSSAGEIGPLLSGWMGERPINLGQRASGEGIAAEYNMRSRKFGIPTLNDIIDYAQHKDQLAIRVIRDGAHVLASVISPVIGLIDPQRVVVGGGLVTIGELWWRTFYETLRANPLPMLEQVDIVQSELNDNAAMIGAALLAHAAAATL